MDRLLGMEVFVSVVETGSLTAAAEQFQISAQMVGKHLRACETRLGVRLLARTTRRQSLTEAGQAYYAQCKNILAEIKVAESGAEALRAAPRGLLKVTAPVTFGSFALTPIIADYLAAQEEVSVELSLNDRVVDIIEEGYDVAIRTGTPTDSGLIARPLCAYQMMICAAPAYLKRFGKPATPADLANHQCLGFTHWKKRGGWSLENSREDTISRHSRFRSNNGQALRTAALAGFGIVMQSNLLLAEDVRAGRLLPILKNYWPAPRPIHLLYPKDRQAVPKLTTFVEFMLARFAK